jgi:uncharacterized protein (DUF433 family)/uncharacterized protein YuzE
MTTVHYDPPSDALYIAFLGGRSAMGIELSNNVLLRIDESAHEVVGLTLFNCSLLEQQEELDTHRFPLTGFADLDADLYELTRQVMRESIQAIGTIRGDVVTVDPDILGGTPVFTGTRVPADSVWHHVHAGDTVDDFLDGFPGVSREQVEAVLCTRVRWVRSPESC